MKTTVLFLFLLLGVMGYGQEKPIKEMTLNELINLSERSKSIDSTEDLTKEYIMDLSRPALVYSKTNSTRWLSMKARQQLVIKIKNGNPLKYTYKIDTKELVFFGEVPSVEIEKEKQNTLGLSVMTHIEALDSIQGIIRLSDLLAGSVNVLEIDFNTFYASMKGKNSIKIDDIKSKREELFKAVMESVNDADILLRGLDFFMDEFEYEDTKNKVTATKEKAEKLKEQITEKLYGFDFATFTLPIDVQGKNIDAIEFRLRRFDKETKEEDTGFAPHPYNVWIRGGLKIDISAGLFFTSLFDDAFDKKDDPVITDNKIIIKKNQGDYDFAFGSSINVHSRWNSWLNMGGNLGVAFTTNQKFQILTGVNFILGRQERIIVTAGLAMGKVDRLANSYKEGGSYNLGAEGTIPMESQFKFGHFFGVTYNLSKVKKISLEKGIEQ
jgi:hypothetical protein